MVKLIIPAWGSGGQTPARLFAK